MNVEVLFFASLRDVVGLAGISLLLPEPAGQVELLAVLGERFSATAMKALQAENVRVSVNQMLATQPFHYSDGDEIAFLPPITGG